MTDISWREKLDNLCEEWPSQGLNNKIADFIESLLAEVKREAAREVIEEIPNSIDSSFAHMEVEDLQSFKQYLRSKYLTPTGNLDQ